MKTADLKSKFVIKLNTRQALTEFLKLNLRDNDAVLFKGSTVTELDEIMTDVT
jgi:UDP-N-acetylmuramyl pentapeptide synthase